MDAGKTQTAEALNPSEMNLFKVGDDACAVAESGQRTVSTMAALQGEMTGIWARCEGGVLPLLEDEIGLEYAANGEWYRLVRDANGIRRSLSDTGKTWSAVSHSQINVSSSAGTLITSPTFSLTPNKMRQSNNGVFTGTWSRGTAGVEVVDTLTPDEVAAFDRATAACAIGESGSRSVTTSAEMTAQMTGIWATCSGSLGPPITGEVGMHFAASGKWAVIVREATGLRRLTTFDGAGRWVVVGAGQVNVIHHSGSTWITGPTFSLTPHKVTMSNNGVFTGVWASDP
jgi:hypothetical protein